MVQGSSEAFKNLPREVLDQFPTNGLRNNPFCDAVGFNVESLVGIALSGLFCNRGHALTPTSLECLQVTALW
jgi:hypothetical protein